MKPFLLLMITGLLTGGALTAGKLAGAEQIPALTMLLWQVGGGGLMLWAVMLVSGRLPRWDSRHVVYYLVGGFFGVSLPFALAYLVLRDIPVGLMGVISALSPLMTYGLARTLGREPGSRRRLFGLVTGLLGVVLVMIPKDTVAGAGMWLSLVLALGVPLSLAVGNVYRSIAWPVGSTPLPLATGMLTVQALWLMPVTLVLGQFQMPGLQAGDSGILGIALALTAGGGYLGSLALLRVGGPVYLSQIGYVVTAATVAIGALLLGEQYGALDWATIGLIFIGILLTSLPEKTATRAACA
jgi:drug/metabolite transporter (DMT)-like permease